MNTQQLMRWRDTAIKAELFKAFPDAESLAKINGAFTAGHKDWLDAEVPEVLPSRQARNVRETLNNDVLDPS